MTDALAQQNWLFLSPSRLRNDSRREPKRRGPTPTEVNKAIFDRYVQNGNLWAMSRPKEFDRAEALTAAKSVFWKKGYDATTTDDLRHAMSIGRQSLYDSFGGKRPLYLEI
jgi:hypothetical protein